MAARYEFSKVEQDIKAFWLENDIYKKAVAKNKGKQKFYFLDGPPYTTGAIHIGHAWNKSLKDCFLRYKRIAGFDIRDQPGFDMHGLPIEVQVEKRLGIKNKNEITEKIGLKKFIDECEAFAISQMQPMIKDFKRLGIWMDWQHPYMTVKNSYIEGAWWALKEAHKNGYLYEGEKAMTWCPRCATALAKHELEYENVTDKSIFVKFKIKGKENEYLIIWTTTPWTIPFNLAVMANPELEYIKAKVDDETWIVAKGQSSFIPAVAGKKFDILEEFKGSALKGLEYEHPFADDIPQYAELKRESPNVHTIVLSKEFVSLGSGSGLVHCAPGCGPEDYQVGRENGIKAFNLIDEAGRFPKALGRFSGLVAKKDDDRFIAALDDKEALVASTPVEHEYAHCWRCKTGVIYKTTTQWFLAVDKLKDKMISLNKKIIWNPDWAGSRWFNSWLTGLQDWCISRQRFWGIPLPIWKCKCGAIKVVSNSKELEALTGKKLQNLHRPWIDEIKIGCECGNEMSRIEDVLDVWLDSGASPWATLEDNSKNIDAVADFILEGKDQIRGWFNSLMTLSMVSRKIPSYKAVYMHGMIMDSQGRKMSKSLKNIISPYEIIDQYGADATRYYMIGAAKPGLDMNYNFEDMKVKYKTLGILWNVKNFIIGLANDAGYTGIISQDIKFWGAEERYIISKTNSAIKKVTELFENYKLNEVPILIEELFLELSRTYLQMVRDKAAIGSRDDKEAVFQVATETFMTALQLISPITPYIAEQIYQEFREAFSLKIESVHLLDWPEANENLIDTKIESQMEYIQQAIQLVLAAREKANLGVRWPAKSVIFETKNIDFAQAVEDLKEIVKKQVNVKDIFVKQDMKMKKKMTINAGAIGKSFKGDAPKIMAKLSMQSSESILQSFDKEGRFLIAERGKEFVITPEHISIAPEVPAHLVLAASKIGNAYLNIEKNKALESEGYAREIIRRVQAFRKNLGLTRKDSIKLSIKADDELTSMLKRWEENISVKVGAEKIDIGMKPPGYSERTKERVKTHNIEIFIEN